MKVDLSTPAKRKAYIDRTGLRFDWNWCESLPGTVEVMAIVPTQCYPVGVVWFTLVGNNTVEIQSLYVVEQVRRAGIAKALLDYVVESWEPKTVMTQGGTKLGKAWMQRVGFKQRKGGDWTLKVKGR